MKLLNLSKSTNYWYGRIRSSSSWQILLHKIRLQGTLKRKLKLENLSLNIPDIKSIKTCNIIILFRNTAAPVSTFSSKLIALLYIFFGLILISYSETPCRFLIQFRDDPLFFPPTQRNIFIDTETGDPAWGHPALYRRTTYYDGEEKCKYSEIELWIIINNGSIAFKEDVRCNYELWW